METQTLRKATRQKALLRLGLAGASGSGKTVSALLLAYGITNDWGKIALIDTENGSADLYANHKLPNGTVIGEFNVLPLTEPYHPVKYINAITTCEQAGMEVIIIDSITHEWNGKGGCLELHEQATQAMKIPNSFTAWAKITPLHQSFIDSILQSKVHIITCVRSKIDYVLSERNGRQVPTKMGMAPQTRDGFEYELTLSLDIDAEHKAFASKDRTGLFAGKPAKIITAETGMFILEWCWEGIDVIKKEPIKPKPEKETDPFKPEPTNGVDTKPQTDDRPLLSDENFAIVFKRLTHNEVQVYEKTINFYRVSKKQKDVLDSAFDMAMDNLNGIEVPTEEAN